MSLSGNFRASQNLVIDTDDATRDLIKRHTPFTAESFVIEHIKGLSGKYEVQLEAELGDDEEYPQIFMVLRSPRIYLNRAFDLGTKSISALNSDVTMGGKGLFKKFFCNNLDVCEKLGIEGIYLNAQEVGKYAWLRYGYVPDQASWAEMRESIQGLMPRLEKKISDNTFRQIEAAITSDNPKAAWLIVDQRETIDGKPVGFHIMSRIGDWMGCLDLTDPDCVSRVRAYSGYQSDKGFTSDMTPTLGESPVTPHPKDPV